MRCLADVGIPADLKAIVKAEDVDFPVQSAMDDACRPGNPKDPTLKTSRTYTYL